MEAISIDVVERSEIRVTPHPYGYRYEFYITLETGETYTFENYANTYDKAMNAAIARSMRMIDHGYQPGM